MRHLLPQSKPGAALIRFKTTFAKQPQLMFMTGHSLNEAYGSTCWSCPFGKFGV